MRTVEKNRYIFFKKKGYRSSWNGIPAFIKPYSKEFSLCGNFFSSIIIHIIIALLFWGTCFIFKSYFSNLMLFDKPKQNMPDIEFILNGNSGNRKKYKKKSSSKSINNNFNKVSQKNNISRIEKKAYLVNNSKIIDDFSIPAPNIKPLGTNFSSSGRSSRKSSAFSNNHTSDGGFDIGTPDGRGVGIKKGFDKNATKKIVSSYDINPYINELKRNIRWNWKYPRGYENKKVELFLRIAKDGRLIILNVKRTSEIGEVDNAALNAVRKTLPLNPLPSAYKKGFLDVVFTFDGSTSVITKK